MASSFAQEDILTTELPPLPFLLDSLVGNGHRFDDDNNPVFENGLELHDPAFDPTQPTEIMDMTSLPPMLDVMGLPRNPSALPQPQHPGKKTLGRMIVSPLPPSDHFEIGDEDYGPVSSSEPRLDSPSRSPPRDKDGSQFDQLDDQYDFMRRTLSHSRRRYSARFKRPRPRPATTRDREGQRDEDVNQSSLDSPEKQRKSVESSLDMPGRIRPPQSQQDPTHVTHPLQKRQTVHGYQQQHGRGPVHAKRRSSPPGAGEGKEQGCSLGWVDVSGAWAWVRVWFSICWDVFLTW